MKTCVRWLLMVAVLGGLPLAYSQLDPDKARKTFKVSDGLEIALWAAEPLFVNPTCMDIDHKGRVWVCESVNYRSKLHRRQPTRPEGDRILILEDTTGKGKADKATVFYQSPELLSPLGIAVYPDADGPGCKVYVCHSPHIYLFEDKDGDGKADGPPKILLTGFGGHDHDHGVHGILIGPDNKLYFSVGDTGVHGLQSSDGKGRKWSSNGTDCRAGTVWRCDLDGKNLQLLAHNFRNEYEPCVDSFGTVFVSDNDDDGNQQTRICYVMPGGDYGYHPRGPGQTHWHEEKPGVVPKVLRTHFGSPTGICFYEGTLLPKKYQGQLLHTDAGPRHLRCYHLTPEGAGYRADREDMVESSDTWFRPSDVCVAPDGSVFVADWYDPGVGGHAMGDRTRGRIYRVTPKDAVKDQGSASAKREPLTAALASPNLARRAQAMAEFARQGLPKARAVLEGAAVQKNDPVLRARALWQLGRLGNMRLTIAAFEDPDPRFRILSMRIMSDFKGSSPAEYIADWQARLLKDPSPAVRREGLLLLRDEDPAKAKDMIYALAKTYDGKDRFFLEAVGIAVGHHDQKRRDIILADFQKHFPEWNEKVAGLVWELRPPGMLGFLEQRIATGKGTPAERSQLMEIVAGLPDAKVANVLLSSLQTEPAADARERIVFHLVQHLPGKWSAIKQSDLLDRVVRALLNRPEGKQAAVQIIAAAGKNGYLADIAALADSNKEPQEVRLAAVKALGESNDVKSHGALRQLIGDPAAPKALRIEALRSLGRHNNDDWSLPVLGKLLKSKEPLDLRQEALAVFAGSKRGSTALLRGHSDKDIPGDLAADVARILRNSPFPDIKSQAQKVFPVPKFDPKNLPSIPALLARKGSLNRGRDLMIASLKNDVACMKCHTIRGEGGQVGPDLSVIGSKASRENLLESILYPSRAVADQYVNWVVETRSGKSYTGLIVEDGPEQILLRDVNAKDHRIARKDIETRMKSPVSLMPENLLQHMREEDLADIVEYLYSLKSAALVPARQ
ncbi:MAG: c-type cytochrome [Planctomycetes bacterium]|nr:c-type cytochrome [Planctomycetota bacterium]